MSKFPREVLQHYGLECYYEVLIENGFDTLESLSDLESYYDILGIKRGHRGRFKTIVEDIDPTLDVEVCFLVVKVNTGAHWGWSSKREFQSKSVVSAWPWITRIDYQNVCVGKLGGRADGTVFFANNREANPGGPYRCQGDVVFFTTKRKLKNAGYNISDWKQSEHTIRVE